MQDWIGKLERAKALLDAGALTQEEFETEKARLLPASSSTHANKGKRLVVEAAERSRLITSIASKKTAIVTVIVMVVATVTYLLFVDQSPEPTSNPPVATVTQPAAIPQTATSTPIARKTLDRTVTQPAATPLITKSMPIAKKPSGWTATEQALIGRWSELNERCRGGLGDDPKTMEACDLREEVSTQLDSSDICYGEEGQHGYQMDMHRCNKNSIARQ